MPESTLGAPDLPDTPAEKQDVPVTTVGDPGMTETSDVMTETSDVVTETGDDVRATQPGTDDRALLSLIGEAVLAVDGVARLEPTLKSLFLARVPGSARDADSPDGIRLTSLGTITDVTVDLAATGDQSSREVAEAVQHVVGQLLETQDREPGRIKVNVLTIERRP